ncbi:hypothetical protein [Companilactobacillus sp.]|uniref:hypothetical protein n=1 Tax=Companilactobacillus sp. TaxID=2767905 RepID=UPI002626DABE|nr:hypothetical protein [Companilactobacillus sp.]
MLKFLAEFEKRVEQAVADEISHKFDVEASSYIGNTKTGSQTQAILYAVADQIKGMFRD